jgi:hypothetical protein
MSIEEQLRNDSEAWRRVGSFHLSDVLLAGANRIRELEQHIKRLEEAGDRLNTFLPERREVWSEAKQARP